MKAAETEAKEMHMQAGATLADDTPEGKAMAQDAAAKRARDRQANLAREGYIPGMSPRPSLLEGLFPEITIPQDCYTRTRTPESARNNEP